MVCATLGIRASAVPVLVSALENISAAYHYSTNNPYAKVDPDGREAVSFEAVLGFGLGVTIGYNRSTSESVITVNAGAGLTGDLELDPRAGENDRAPPADSTRPAAAGAWGHQLHEFYLRRYRRGRRRIRHRADVHADG